MPLFAKRRAERLHAEAQLRSDQGDDDAALAIYAQALALDPERPQSLFNVGLIYKHRRAWRESFDSNLCAFELRSDDEAIRWNLAIAATALEDWSTARRMWALCGYEIGEGEGPIEADFGLTPVRLNSEGDEAEVVWARRVDPVRARLNSVPFPQSGFYYGDVVLHDGAPAGSRMVNGREYPVFNVFERLKRSAFGTATATVVAPSEPDLSALVDACDAAEFPAEDWTSNVRWLCKQCSEGVAHEAHDQDLPDPVWVSDRDIGFGIRAPAELQTVLDVWSAGPGRYVRDLKFVT